MRVRMVFQRSITSLNHHLPAALSVESASASTMQQRMVCREKTIGYWSLRQQVILAKSADVRGVLADDIRDISLHVLGPAAG